MRFLNSSAIFTGERRALSWAYQVSKMGVWSFTERMKELEYRSEDENRYVFSFCAAARMSSIDCFSTGYAPVTCVNTTPSTLTPCGSGQLFRNVFMVSF